MTARALPSLTRVLGRLRDRLPGAQPRRPDNRPVPNGVNLLRPRLQVMPQARIRDARLSSRIFQRIRSRRTSENKTTTCRVAQRYRLGLVLVLPLIHARSYTVQAARAETRRTMGTEGDWGCV
jgi:hypothetical protein